MFEKVLPKPKYKLCPEIQNTSSGINLNKELAKTYSKIFVFKNKLNSFYILNTW